MEISFTGTRYGMSEFQRNSLENFLLSLSRNNSITSFSHGCCLGADIQFHEIIRKLFGKYVTIKVFPSTASTAAAIPEDSDYVHERLAPMKRNKLIVDAGKDLLLATPLHNQETIRSGTWSAIRYARKIGVNCMIFPRNKE